MTPLTSSIVVGILESVGVVFAYGLSLWRMFSRCRSSSVDSDRARKWEPVTLKAVVGPVMGNSLEVGNLARARALIEKNAKRTILCTRQVLTF
jgi:hypothetical protein